MHFLGLGIGSPQNLPQLVLSHFLTYQGISADSQLEPQEQLQRLERRPRRFEPYPRLLGREAQSGYSTMERHFGSSCIDAVADHRRQM